MSSGEVYGHLGRWPQNLSTGQTEVFLLSSAPPRLLACNALACQASILLFSLSSNASGALHASLECKECDSRNGEQVGFSSFNLDFYTDVQDLHISKILWITTLGLLSIGKALAFWWKLTHELCEVVEDFGLVSFTTLNIQDKESVMELLKIIDKSNGYVFRGIEGNINEFNKLAAAPTNWDYDRTMAVQEKYIKDDEDDKDLTS